MSLTDNRDVALSIVIVNFRTPAFVMECLASLLPELNGMDARVVIVDNHSQDDSCEVIQRWMSEYDREKQVLLIQSTTNSGFSGGNNQGIKAQKANAYLLLNSDTLIRHGAIRILVETLHEYPSAGIFSPRLEWLDGTGQESCFRYHTPISELSHAAKAGVLDFLLSNFIVPFPVQSKVHYPEWTSFACVLIKDKVFQQIGLLDDGYFMYFEDVEFCRRARKAGWRIVHNPAARVVHLRGGSSPVKENMLQKKRLPLYYYESRTRFFYQAYGWTGLLAANLLWWIGRSLSKTRQLLGRLDKASIKRQWLDIWRNCTDPLRPYTHPDSDR
ncbi:MAG: glycosyltransferase family 2 protein [Candidatus Sedimenticola sp. (ex Thyasira tokunagai)]